MNHILQCIHFYYIIIVLDRPKGPLVHLLRPNTIQSPNTTFDNITCDTPFSHKGDARSKRDRFKRTITSLHVSAINSLRGYTSHDFVTAGARCAITTALHPSTFINRGLVAVPKIESNSSSKPSLFDLY